VVAPLQAKPICIEIREARDQIAVVSHWLHSRPDAEQFEGAGLQGRRLGREIEAVFPVAGQADLNGGRAPRTGRSLSR